MLHRFELRSLAQDVGTIVTSDLFNEMLKNQNDDRCPALGFYTYDAFIGAANSFPGFGTTGDDTAREKEIAAFFGQTSHETTGGSLSADGPFAGGYCFLREGNQVGSGFYGRGPIQLTGQSNYDLAGQAIGQDLVNNPDLVATDSTVSFKTAIWFWMTAQGHHATTLSQGNGRHQQIDNQATNPQVEDRIGFYRRYCTILNVAPGDNLDCYTQRNFAEA
ncbi:hypothetical protein H5410_008428 [Solanum commersonii]|uniref:chitinase n=1 Tax=Solanum commersonii TaxID=4109 RepID=A0A9J6AGJ3_SOLCO|nr:hypothetical protein H5410_008428 [Solanum commersonii]